MNPETIIHGVSYLAVATGHEITEERMTIYLAQLADLKNEKLWRDTMQVLVNSSQYMPTVAEIRAAYHELLHQYRPANALAAGEDSGWEHAGGAYEDCLGTCGRKHRLVDLMQRNGYCRECVPVEVAVSRMPNFPKLRSVGGTA